MGLNKDQLTYSRKYRAANQEKLNSNNRRYRARNRERINAEQREHHAANRQRINAHKREWWAANRERINARNREYYAAHAEELNKKRRGHRRPEQMFAHYAVQTAIQKGILAPPTIYTCSDCDEPATEYDHHDYSLPLYVFPTCHGCNVRRGEAIDWYLIPDKSC